MSDIKLGNNNVTFKVGSTDVNAIYIGDTLIYSGSTPPTPHDYLTFRALEDGTFKLSGNSINYSTDSGVTWTELASNTNSPTVQSGQTIMWKGTLSASSSNGIGTFSSTGRFEVEGNAMSLKYGDNFSDKTTLPDNYSFAKLFYNCGSLTSAENLVLPATALTQSCYNSMFYYCTSLNTAPSLPATALAQTCYQNMFYWCSSLNSITCLATDISASNCTQNWVRSVGYVGTFYKAASMNDWDAGANGVPAGWTLTDYSS